MPRTTHYDCVCGQCGEEFTATEAIWPATRWEPSDGEIRPEECPKCGEPVSENVTLEVAEPPDRY